MREVQQQSAGVTGIRARGAAPRMQKIILSREGRDLEYKQAMNGR